MIKHCKLNEGMQPKLLVILVVSLLELCETMEVALRMLAASGGRRLFKAIGKLTDLASCLIERSS
jgi:hypothetical protein